jgi:hypothetical protein
MATPATTIREKLGRSGRLASLGLRRSEQGIDFQVELEDLERDNHQEARTLENEIALDAADDRRRFLKYRAVEHALRHGTQNEQLAAFHQLVGHIEHDEMREDATRLGTRKARLLHEARLRGLRAIFRDEIMPILVGSVDSAPDQVRA